MKESEAKKRACPKFFAAFIANGKGNQKEMESLCLCQGNICMMWEADQKKIEMRIDKAKINTQAEAEKHVPDGWLFGGFMYSIGEISSHVDIYRYVDSDSGDCGLKTKELYCEGCNQ